ncbi:MAG TPA: hypothetical protein PL002_15350 [Flavobacteriales bacterium]|nr:hypothetical protein [Flavobacteriales bacterium]
MRSAFFNAIPAIMLGLLAGPALAQNKGHLEQLFPERVMIGVGHGSWSVEV